MDLVGFSFRKGYLLATTAGEYDLHNDFDFVECAHDSTSCCTRISWTRAKGDWVDKSQPASFTVEFRGVSRHRTKNGLEGAATGDRQTFAFVGFLQADDVEVMNGYFDEQTNREQDLIFGFEDGSAIRLHAESAILTEVGE